MLGSGSPGYLEALFMTNVAWCTRFIGASKLFRGPPSRQMISGND